MASYIAAIGTAVPKYKMTQSAIAEQMSATLGLNEEETHQMQVLYRATGIASRFSILPDFSNEILHKGIFSNSKIEEPGTAQRMAVYRQEAPKLATDACRDCFSSISTPPEEITHLITVSCTGMYAPGLDIDLVKILRLRKSIKRTGVYFMGCYAAFTAMKIADDICKADFEAKVLVVCVELCTLHFHHSSEQERILAASLFADGAAAILVQGNKPSGISLSPKAFHCDLALEGDKEMAWEIGDFGYEMKLTSYVPDLIKAGIGKLTDSLISSVSGKDSDIYHYAMHPGGRRILQVIEEELSIPRAENRTAHDVLRDYGNMSSPTVLFVLKKIFEQLTPKSAGEKILSFAFGPGLTMESAVLEVNA